jgi:hypothetical protein
VLRRIQVQTDDVGGFRFEIRIVAGQVTLDPMRFQARFFPHPVHHVLADAQRCGKLAATPVGGTVLWLFACRGENPSSQSGSQHECRLSGMIGIQTVDPRSKETLLPAAYRRCRSSQPLLDRAERHTFGQHENQPGTEDISCRKRTRLGDAAEFKLLGFTEYHGIIGHTCLDADRASNVYSATSH